MKIYKNEKGQIVVDGDGITTIEVPENIRGVIGVNEWLESRLVYSGNKPLIEETMEGKIMWTGKVIITGFTFKWEKLVKNKVSIKDCFHKTIES